MAVITVDELEVTYHQIKAVDKVCFHVEQGEIFGMLGPNGAGKTTTIECLEGIRDNYSGRINILGLDPKKNRKDLLSRIGVQLQETAYPDKIKVWEICRLFTTFYSTPGNYEELLEDFGLHDKRNAYISSLSGGQKQKLSVILALIPNPSVLFLDELTTGLDPQARRLTWDAIKKLKDKGITVYMTTHFMDEAEYLCDRIAIMNQGKLEAINTIDTLIEHTGLEQKVRFSLDNNLDEARIHYLRGIYQMDILGKEVTIFGKGRNIHMDIVKYLHDNQIAYSNLSVQKPNLEDVYLRLTGNQISELGEVV